jgi:hypothetical protein
VRQYPFSTWQRKIIKISGLAIKLDLNLKIIKCNSNNNLNIAYTPMMTDPQVGNDKPLPKSPRKGQNG